MGKYLVAVLRYNHQQNDPMYIQQLTQFFCPLWILWIFASISPFSSFTKLILVMPLYNTSSFYVFSSLLLPSTHPSSISEMSATVNTLQITSIKNQNLYYGLLLKQACNFLSQHTPSTQYLVSSVTPNINSKTDPHLWFYVCCLKPTNK